MRTYLSFLFLFLSAYALPVSNPADPEVLRKNWLFNSDCCDPALRPVSCFDDYQFRLGYTGNFVYNRHTEGTGNSGTTADTQIMTNSALFVVNVWQVIDFFATVGVTNFFARSSGVDYFFSPSMSYSGGATLNILELDRFYIGASGQYFYSPARLDSLVQIASGAVTYFNDSRASNYQEWQGALSCAYRFEYRPSFMLIPYTAIQFAGLRWNLSRPLVGFPALLRDQEPQKITGWTIGMSALMRQLLMVSVEARFANEKALSVIGQLQF